MKVYFLSSKPCALTLNGVFFGVTNSFRRFAEIDLRDNVFVCFSPENAQPVRFFLTERIRAQAPDGCEVYLLHDGIALHACDFPPTDCAMRPIAQKRNGDCLATVYAQGRIQLSLTSPDGFFNATLPPAFEQCEIIFHGEYLLLHTQKEFALFNQKAECLLLEQMLDFELQGDVLRARLPLFDSQNRVADCAWALENGGCKQTQFTLQAQGDKETITQTLESLLPYAFFESVLLGADYAQFLGGDLKENAAALPDFLGKFIDVTLTENPVCCGLVYPKGDRIFELRYYETEIQNGKIADVKRAK